MTSSQKRREFVRNICLESNICSTTKHDKSFLRRNVKQALERHQLWLRRRQRLLNGRFEPADSTSGASRTTPIWEPPDEAMLKELIDLDERSLAIDVVRIRSLASSNVQSAKRKRPSTSPDWLPASENPLQLCCNVSIVVLDNSPATSTRQVLSQHVTPGTLTSRTGSDGTTYFDVQLRKPCRFFLSELQPNQDSTDTLTVPQYGLEIHFECRDYGERAAFISMIESKSLVDYMFTPTSEMKLRCKTSDLRGCKASGPLLQLTRTSGHRRIKLGYGVELSANWTPSRKAKQLSSFNARHKHISTPTSAASVAQTRKKAIRWAYRTAGYGVAVHEAKDLRCVFCENSLPHSSITYLLLHLKLHHGHFNVEHSSDIDEIGISVSKTTVEEVQQLSQDEEEELVLPSTPFDTSAPCNDPRAWGKYNRTRHDRDVQVQSKVTEAGRQTPATAPSRAAQSRTTISAEDSQPRPRKVVKVPNVPGAQLFRRISKRVITGGEEISDEEEGIKQSFPLVDHHGAPSDLERTEADRLFGRLWSKHLSLNPIKADIYARASVERFARKYKAELSTPEMKDEFSKRLDQFLSYGIIDAETVSTCLNVITIPEVDTRPGAAADVDVSKASPVSTAATSQYKSPSKPQQQNDATLSANRATGNTTAKRSRPDSMVSPSPSDSASPSKRVKWAGGSSFAPVDDTAQAPPGVAPTPQPPSISVGAQDRIRITLPNGSQVVVFAMDVAKSTEHDSEGHVPERVELRDLDFTKIMGRVRSKLRIPYDIQTGRLSDYSLGWEHRNGTLTCWDEAGWQKVLLKAIELPNIEKSLDGFRVVGDRRQDKASGQGEMALVLDKEMWIVIPDHIPRGVRWEKTQSGEPRVWGPLSHPFWESLYQPEESGGMEVNGGPPRKTALKSPRESAPPGAASSKGNERATTLNGNDTSPRTRIPSAKSTATPLKKKEKGSTNADEEQSSTKPPRRGMCICGKPADRSPSCIMCRDPKCRFKIFHLKCVKLEQRYPGWTCDYCPLGAG